jgi:hypothetical protein
VVLIVLVLDSAVKNADAACSQPGWPVRDEAILFKVLLLAICTLPVDQADGCCDNRRDVITKDIASETMGRAAHGKDGPSIARGLQPAEFISGEVQITTNSIDTATAPDSR